MTGTDIALLVFVAVLIPVAGVFAAADAAITTVSAARVEEMHRERQRGAASLAAIVADRSRYINLLLMLRLAAEITATVTLAVIALGIWGFHFLVAAGVAVVMLLLGYAVIGVLPRTLGRQHPYAIGLALAGPMRALGRVLSPISGLLVVVGNALTPGRPFSHDPLSSDVELREMVDLAGDSGVVHESEREMLQSVFDLGDTIVREVMVPRTEMVWIEASKTLRQAVHLADRSGFSRVPVIGEDADDVLGVVYVKDLIARLLSLPPDARGPQVTELMRPAVFVPESKNVDELLRDMQRDRTHMAMVVDEYGGIAGLVTMEDIVEEIVGEITDEYDADTPDPIEHLADGSVRVSARLPVEDLGDIFDVELPGDDVETVGGLLSQELGRVALPGSTVEVQGLRLVAEGGFDRRGRHRVLSVLARRVELDTGQGDSQAGMPADGVAGAGADTAADSPAGPDGGAPVGPAADAPADGPADGPADALADHPGDVPSGGLADVLTDGRGAPDDGTGRARRPDRTDGEDSMAADADGDVRDAAAPGPGGPA